MGRLMRESQHKIVLTMDGRFACRVCLGFSGKATRAKRIFMESECPCGNLSSCHYSQPHGTHRHQWVSRCKSVVCLRCGATCAAPGKLKRPCTRVARADPLAEHTQGDSDMELIVESPDREGGLDLGFPPGAPEGPRGVGVGEGAPPQRPQNYLDEEEADPFIFEEEEGD